MGAIAEAFTEYAQPLLDATDGSAEQAERALTLAQVCWNMALEPEGERDEALRNLRPGGRLVINAIRKEDRDREYLLNLDYTEHLWLEKEIKSVANVARRDIAEFLDLASRIPIRPEVQEFELREANRALAELKEGRIRGAKVLRI